MDPLEAIKVTFFQECEELLADLEAGLLALEEGAGDAETINAVFRAVHSIKGGAGAFGLDSLVRFAHVFETVLDDMRSGRLAPDPEPLKVMLRAADVLSDLVAAAKAGQPGEDARAADLVRELESLRGVDEADAAPDDSGEIEGLDFTPVAIDLAPVDPPAPAEQRYAVEFHPLRAMYGAANDPLLLLRELERLGPCEIVLDAQALPPLEAMEPDESYLTWKVELTTAQDEAAIREVFEFVEGDCQLSITAAEPAEAALSLDIDIASLLSAAAPHVAEALPPLDAPAAAPIETVQPAAAAAPAVPAAPTAAAAGAPAAAPQATIRVDLDRVDRLIDLVGELVINQGMLAQRVAESDLARSSHIAVGLDELEQLTREIQDSVMAIRAQPVKSVFQRMPRLVREAAAATGKQVRLVTEGEGTEVDKTVIERLTDPITHMIRNAVDHGLETPDERVAAGKPPEGTVKLTAAHRSGRIVIEVTDDGKGINRARVRDIAVSKGLIDANAVLTDDEIDNLIFMPGFSTAETVTDLSGRGVGMDVVKRSIQALGGRIHIASRPGEGSVFTMSLPLTLAVLDGMVVTAADQTLVAPLTTVIETLQPKPEDIRALGPTGAVLVVRNTHVPIVDVGVALGYRTAAVDPSEGVALLVEAAGGGRAALLVDAIQGQRQVVIKSLEANFQQVEGIAAATILGDGRVALILDVDAVIASRRRGSGAAAASAPILKAAS